MPTLAEERFVVARPGRGRRQGAVVAAVSAMRRATPVYKTCTVATFSLPILLIGPQKGDFSKTGGRWLVK